MKVTGDDLQFHVFTDVPPLETIDVMTSHLIRLTNTFGTDCPRLGFEWPRLDTDEYWLSEFRKS